MIDEDKFLVIRNYYFWLFSIRFRIWSKKLIKDLDFVLREYGEENAFEFRKPYFFIGSLLFGYQSSHTCYYETKTGKFVEFMTEDRFEEDELE